MPKTFTIGTYDKKHKENLAKRARKVQQLYDAAIKRIVQTAAPSLFDADTKKEFHFEDFPALKKEMEALMQDLGNSLQANIEDGDQESWTLSNTKNDAMVDSIIGKKHLPKKVVQTWKHPHLEALNAFIARKEAGMNLSRRVWNLTQQFKSEMELALELGMGEGKSAAALSRDIRKYLVEPNKLFRRVRDKSGALRLSKAAAAYHPGQGVYRSSYKNALRMTATENNIAYRTADHNRWQALPFVIGIEIHISNNHPTEDICDLFDGKRFPKDFKFTGWHPWCRCYAVSVLASQEEMDAYTTAIMNGEDVSHWKFTGQVEKMPKEFNKWMKDNQARIENATSMPYFIKDNFKDGDPAKGLRWEGMEKSNKKDGAIAATPKSKPADEWKGISKNDRELLELVQTEGWTEQNQDHYRDLLDKAYDAEMKKANLKPTKLRTKAEEDAVDSFRQWGFEELNEALRAGKPLNAKQREVQEQIDKIMSRTTLKKDIVVYRGTKDAPIDINPAYSSTTTRITIAEHFSSEMYGSKHLYAYRIPKGTHCLIIGGAEDEIVLPRGFNLGQYKIGAKKTEPAVIKKPTAKEIAAKRHAARTSEQASDIQTKWDESRSNASIVAKAKRTMRIAERFPAYSNIKLKRALEKTDYKRLAKVTAEERGYLAEWVGMERKTIEARILLNTTNSIDAGTRNYILHEILTIEKALKAKGRNAYGNAKDGVKNLEKELAAFKPVKTLKKDAKFIERLDAGETAEQLAARLGKDCPATLKNFAKTVNRLEADVVGEFSQEEIQVFKDTAREMFRKYDFATNTKAKYLENILDDHLKNLQETGTSGGGTNVQSRINTSHDNFGISKTAKAEEFEKYGLLAEKDVNKRVGGDWYGQTTIRWNKDKVNATFTMDDSLDDYAFIAPSLVTDPKITSIAARNGRNIRCVDLNQFKAIQQASKKGIADMLDKMPGVYYIELQYHGQLTMDCIESVTFAEKSEARVAKKAIKKLLQKGIPCYIQNENAKQADRITEQIFKTL